MRDDLQQLLDGASPIELEEISTYVQFRLAKSTKGDVAHAEFGFWLCLCAAIDNGSCTPTQPGLLAFIGGNKTGFGLRPYRQAMSVMTAYIDKGISRLTLTKLQRKQLTTLLLNAVVLRAQHVGAPITPAIVLQHATNSLAAAVEWQYPGYYRSGMLHVLVTTKVGGTH